MQFNVADLLKDSTGATREHDLDERVRIDGEPRPVRGHVRFDRTPDGVLVRATLRGEESAQCSRCLAPVTYAIDLTIEEEYIPIVDVVTGGRVQAPEGEEDAYRINERHILDLTEPVQQYWAMARPMAPLCRDDCPGICPSCGEEVREGHACAQDQSDSRWEKLRDLKLK
jgi:uncharacterized protein